MAKNILHCSFCGRSRDEVKILIAGQEGHICENCVEHAREIIDQELNRFRGWFRGLGAEPIIARLQKQAEKIRQRELADALQRFPKETHEDLERLTRSLVRKILHHPSSRLRARDGSYRWHLSRANPVLDADGEITRWFGTATDIHDLRMAEERLRESEQRLRVDLLDPQRDAEMIRRQLGQPRRFTRFRRPAGLVSAQDPAARRRPARLRREHRPPLAADHRRPREGVGTDLRDRDREAVRDGVVHGDELELVRPEGEGVPLLHHVLHGIHAVVGQLGYVDQALHAWGQFHERAAPINSSTACTSLGSSGFTSGANRSTTSPPSRRKPHE